MNDVWKETTLILGGLLIGGIAGVIRGDWLGARAALVVKENLELQLSFVREEHSRLETRVYSELQTLNLKIDRLLNSRED